MTQLEHIYIFIYYIQYTIGYICCKYAHRHGWVRTSGLFSSFIPSSPFENGSLPFIFPITKVQSANFRLHGKEKENGQREIIWVAVFRLTASPGQLKKMTKKEEKLVAVEIQRVLTVKTFFAISKQSFAKF